MVVKCEENSQSQINCIVFQITLSNSIYGGQLCTYENIHGDEGDECKFCGGLGHIIAECQKLKKQQKKAKEIKEDEFGQQLCQKIEEKKQMEAGMMGPQVPML